MKWVLDSCSISFEHTYKKNSDIFTMQQQLTIAIMQSKLFKVLFCWTSDVLQMFFVSVTIILAASLFKWKCLIIGQTTGVLPQGAVLEILWYVHMSNIQYMFLIITLLRHFHVTSATESLCASNGNHTRRQEVYGVFSTLSVIISRKFEMRSGICKHIYSQYWYLVVHKKESTELTLEQLCYFSTLMKINLRVWSICSLLIRLEKPGLCLVGL